MKTIQLRSHGRRETASRPVRDGELSPAGRSSAGRRGQRGGRVRSGAKPSQGHALLPARLGHQPPSCSQVATATAFHSRMISVQSCRGGIVIVRPYLRGCQLHPQGTHLRPPEAVVCWDELRGPLQGAELPCPTGAHHLQQVCLSHH